jgi:hypothetical protein
MSEAEEKLREIQEELRIARAKLNEPISDRQRAFILAAIDRFEKAQEGYAFLVSLER